MANPRSEIIFPDFVKIKKALKEIEPRLVNEYFRGAKEAAKPVQDSIQKAIPNTAPIRGMRPVSERARLGWGIGKRARSTQIRVNRTVKRGSSFARGRTNQYSISYVAVRSPGTILADMAGKSGKWIDKYEFSREHEINLFGLGRIVKRRFRLNNHGNNLITALSKSGKVQESKASRMIWPGALKALPQAAKAIDDLNQSAIIKINRYMETLDGSR